LGLQSGGFPIALRERPLLLRFQSRQRPDLDYTQWANLKKARYLQLYISLPSYAAAHKQLALIFGFDVIYSSLPARLLVYSDAGLLQDQQLVFGDNQFLLEIESLDSGFSLYFVHARGAWFFRGLSGYVV
jgi:hypothetical protein